MSYFLHNREQEECIPIAVPALVTPDVWERVQARLQDNKSRLSGRKSRRFPLSGLFRCPVCRNRCSVAHKHGKGHTYFCREKRICHLHTYGGQTAERAVYTILRDLSRQPELVKAALKVYAAKPKNEEAHTRATLLKNLTKLQDKEKATVTAQTAGIQAGADPAVYESLFAEIAATRRELQARLGAMEAPDNVLAFVPKDTATLLSQAITDMDTALFDEMVEPAEKNALLSSVIRSVYPLNREGDYRVELCPLPGSGLTLQQALS